MKKNSYLSKAVRPPSKIRLFLQSMGPGIVTGAADDDPSGIGTYTQAGAQFGLAFLWTALLSWPLMAAVQMACARIGLVTGEGLSAALKKKFPRSLLLFFCTAIFIANTLNVGADLSAMADSAEMLGLGSSHVYVVVFGLAIAWATIRLKYFHIARVLKWLALSLFSYIVVAFLARPDWRMTFHATFLPSWPRGKAQWSMLVAILGTTISPYLFFWQASQEVEEKKAGGKDTLKKRIGASEEDITARRYDVGIGILFSNLVMYFIILAAALTLNKNGVTAIETSRQAAEALIPLAGRFASLLYSVGLLGVGFLAIPTLTASAAYAIAETFGWDQGLGAKPNKAKAFYAVIVVSTFFAILFDFADVSPLKALYGSAVVNGLLAPFVLTAVLFVIKDKAIMKNNPAPRLEFGIVAACTLMMYAAALGMFYFA